MNTNNKTRLRSAERGVNKWTSHHDIAGVGLPSSRPHRGPLLEKKLALLEKGACSRPVPSRGATKADRVGS